MTTQGGWFFDNSDWIYKKKGETVFFSRNITTLFSCDGKSNISIENCSFLIPGELTARKTAFNTFLLMGMTDNLLNKMILLNTHGKTYPFSALLTTNLIIQKCQIEAYLIPEDPLLYYGNNSECQLLDITYTPISKNDFDNIIQSADRKE